MTEAQQLASILQSLNDKWTPHKAQLNVLRSIFKSRKSMLFLESGRKFGKSEVTSYFLWRKALTEPGGYYYLAPEQKQAREILWAPHRIQTFGPDSYIAGINNTEMRINFKNGSYIKVDGSDNYNSYRGITPHGVVYDEFRDFRPEFHGVMGPNLAVYGAPLLIATTPPELDLEHYDGLMAQCQGDGSYFNYTSFENPHISHEWLRQEKIKLELRGEWDVWEREYMARRVRGGKSSIFPMFDDNKHVIKDMFLYQIVSRETHKLQWWAVADPASMSTFGVLVGAYDRWSKKLYIFREIYESSQANMSVSRILPRIKEIQEHVFPGHKLYNKDFDQVYDEAAAWFANECMTSYEDHWTPTSKASRGKEDGLSAIKDLMIAEKLVISDTCVNLRGEIINYIKDKNGKAIKERDHLIDCLRYIVGYYGIGIADEIQPAKNLPKSRKLKDDPIFNNDDSDFENFLDRELA
jgi:hypothetical protein